MRPNRPRFANVCWLLILVMGLGCSQHPPAPTATPPAIREHSAERKGRVDDRSAPSPNAGGEVIAARPHFYNRVVVLSIGVSRYRSASIPELSYAAADAKDVAERLRDLYGYDPAPLLGTRATKQAIEAALDRFGEQLGEQDSLIIYFAGHGQVIDLPSHGRAGYLIPYDADLDLGNTSDPVRWAEDAIDVHRLVGRIEAMKAQHVLLVSDACCSGFMTARGNLEGRPDLQAVLTQPSRGVLAATTERQAAAEDRSTGHGYFTAAFLDQIEEFSRNGDAASITDLFVEVRRRVAQASNKTMTPQMSCRGEGEFVFLPRSIPREDIEAILGTSPPGNTILGGVLERRLQRTARRTTTEDVIEAYQAYDYRFSIDPRKGEEGWQGKRRRFEENASLGDPLAMAGMHYCASRGLGQEKDPEMAYSWAVKAHDTGSPAGKHMLARCYYWGYGTPKNEAAARNLYEAAAKEGFPISKFIICKDTLKKFDDQSKDGKEVTFEEGKLQQTLVNLRAAADAGVDVAAQALAMMIRRGVKGVGGFEKDPPSSIKIIYHYIINKDSSSLLNVRLAEFLEDAYQPEADRDHQRALAELRKAAAAGDDRGQYLLAIELLNKNGGPGDDAEAFRWADLSERQGYLGAELLLFKMYLGGRGVPRHSEKAIQYLEKGEAAGSVGAILELGHVYWDGELRNRDKNRALRYYLRAAELGSADGFFYAGILCKSEYDRSITFTKYIIKTLISDPIKLRKEGIICLAIAELMGHKMASFELRSGSLLDDRFMARLRSEIKPAGGNQEQSINILKYILFSGNY